MHDAGRRNFLRYAAGAAGAFALGGGGLYALATSATGLERERRFAPVKVSRERLIRTTVGLRPYRAEGFVVRAERLGEKLLVHNYGHGGAGMSLSWGTAAMAVEHALGAGQKSFAVVGCGVNGLSTARLLQRRGGEVTVYAKELPPETTSNLSGALWYPTSSFHAPRVTPSFLEQFRLACQISNRAFQILVGRDYGVRWLESYTLRREPPPPEHQMIGGADLYPETTVRRDPKRYFGFPHVTQFQTLMIEPHAYMNALLRDFRSAGGRVVVREFRGPEELAALAEPVVVNCTGLGAKALFGDTGLSPVRGQLEILLPQPEVDYCYLHGPVYMFPRADGIVLGGTFEPERASLAPDPEQTNYILESHANIMKGLRKGRLEDEPRG